MSAESILFLQLLSEEYSKTTVAFTLQLRGNLKYIGECIYLNANFVILKALRLGYWPGILNQSTTDIGEILCLQNK